MARVFVSCARDDQALASDVCRRLEQAGHEVVPGRDTRDGIVSGEHWRLRLDEWLGWADAVVCVVTSASVASSRCIAEIATAQARGKRVLPLRAGLDHPLLADIQYTDLTRDPAAAWAALVEAVRRSAAAEGGGWPVGRSPDCARSTATSNGCSSAVMRRAGIWRNGCAALPGEPQSW